MLNKLIFFNEFGAGDIFESREFVKQIINLVPAKEYYYSHGKPKDILADIPELQFVEFDKSKFNSMQDVIDLDDNSMAWNTWIGRDGGYVLPGIGCVVEQHYRMNNDMLSKVTDKRLPGVPYDYFTNLDFSHYYKDSIDRFVSQYRGKKVLISNGPVQSSQAENFDFSPAIHMLSDRFPYILFLLTQPVAEEFSNENVFFTSAITDKSGFDLNEISYLSQFCDVIVGRSSGPFTFCSTMKNIEDKSKTFISFTYTPTGASFFTNQVTPASKYWYPYTSTNDVYNAIASEVEKL